MSLAVLQGAKLVLQDYASGSRPLIDAALARNGIQANIVQEIGHPATLFPMVARQASASVFFPHWRYHCLKVAHWW